MNFLEKNVLISKECRPEEAKCKQNLKIKCTSWRNWLLGGHICAFPKLYMRIGCVGSAGIPLAEVELENGNVLKSRLIIGADGPNSQVIHIIIVCIEFNWEQFFSIWLLHWKTEKEASTEFVVFFPYLSLSCLQVLILQSWLFSKGNYNHMMWIEPQSSLSSSRYLDAHNLVQTRACRLTQTIFFQNLPASFQYPLCHILAVK